VNVLFQLLLMSGTNDAGAPLPRSASRPSYAAGRTFCASMRARGRSPLTKTLTARSTTARPE